MSGVLETDSDLVFVVIPGSDPESKILNQVQDDGKVQG